jgi:hypothetical protein
MEAPPKKRSKRDNDQLRRVIGQSGVSLTNLKKLLGTLRHEESSSIDALTSCGYRALLKANAEGFLEVRCFEELETISGGTFTWELCEPGQLLALMLAASPQLQEIYASVANERAIDMDNPLSLIVAFDEYTPGNKLKLENHKKVMVLSFNFMELGKRSLSRTITWMVPIVVRHSVIVRIKGGWPNMLKRYLHRQLLGSQSGLTTSGTVVMIGGSPLVIFARLTNLVSDGDGLRDALDWRGANSLKPSFRHSKVLKLDSELADLNPEEYVEIDCDDPSRIKGWSNTEFEAVVDLIQQAHDRCVDGRLTKKTLEDICFSHGLNYNADGLIWDTSLRDVVKPVDIVTVDWMHTALQNGFLTVDAFQFLSAAGVPFPTMEAYLQTDICFPSMHRSKSNELHRVFDSFRHRSSKRADALKATASELLGLYALIRHYVETKVPNDRAPLAQASFDACCKCVDIINWARHGRITTAEAAPMLKAAVQDYIRKHKAAYGKDHLIPKHAWLWDIVSQMERDIEVLDMFVVERGHLGVKHIAERVDNLRVYERSVLSGHITDRLRLLHEQQAPTRLLGKEVLSREYPNSVFSRSMAFDSLLLSVGDVVVRENELGRIVACARETRAKETVLMIIVEDGNFLRYRSENSRIYDFEGHLSVWEPLAVQVATAWYNYSDNNESCLVVLMP